MSSDRPTFISAAMELRASSVAGSSGTPETFLSINAARRRMICRSARDISAMRSAAPSSSSAIYRRVIQSHLVVGVRRFPGKSAQIGRWFSTQVLAPERPNHFQDCCMSRDGWIRAHDERYSIFSRGSEITGASATRPEVLPRCSYLFGRKRIRTRKPLRLSDQVKRGIPLDGLFGIGEGNKFSPRLAR